MIQPLELNGKDAAGHIVGRSANSFSPPLLPIFDLIFLSYASSAAHTEPDEAPPLQSLPQSTNPKDQIMSGSYNFLLHILGFGFLCTVLFGGYLLDRKFRKESDWSKKAMIGGIMKSFGMLSPIVAAILLITGIGNIHIRYADTGIAWYEERWLLEKLFLFLILLINGTIIGPRMSRGRMKLVLGILEKNAPSDAEQAVKSYNKKISVFYTIQSILLLAILYLSVFGSAKHPGAF